MVRHIRVNMKKVRGKAHTLKPNIIAKKRGEAYRNATGIIVRLPRVVRLAREVRKAEAARLAEVTGVPLPEKEEKVIYKSFGEVVAKAVDASAKLQIELAADIAKQRSLSKKPGAGVKMKKSDLQLAQKWMLKIAKSRK